MLDIYVGNLAARASVDDVRELFNGVSKGQTIGSRVRARLSGLLAHTFPERFHYSPPDSGLTFTLVENMQGAYARYCRVSGGSRVVATTLISQLEGAGLHGRALEVRPFYPRTFTNDRRRAGWRFHRWLGVERRQNERRHER